MHDDPRSLALAAAESGNLSDAVKHCADVAGDDPQKLTHLGIAQHLLKQYEQAEQSLRRAVAIQPTLDKAWSNLGATIFAQGRWQEAEACYREAVKLDPKNANAWSNLGNALRRQLRFAEAEGSLRESLRLHRLEDPSNGPVCHNLGVVMAEQGKLAEAELFYRRALQLGFRPTLHNLALCLLNQGEFDEAARVSAERLADAPDDPEAHSANAYNLLTMGRWLEAWPDYEWRLQTVGFAKIRHDWPMPKWKGEDITGKTVLVHADQGLGDTILASRFVPMVKARGARRVLFAAQKALHNLLGPATLEPVDSDDPRVLETGDIDYQIALMSLPGILGITPETVPPPLSIRCDDSYHLAGIGPGEIVIGICWQGDPKYGADHRRSIPLEKFAPLAAVPGVRLVSLQRGHGTEQLKDVSFPIEQFDAENFDKEPFADTAAIMANLDLFIGPDTALVHLAATLGVPTWIALDAAPIWLWLRGRDDTPWYKSVRLWRQERWGDWDAVMERMAGELSSLAQTRTCSGT